MNRDRSHLISLAPPLGFNSFPRWATSKRSYLDWWMLAKFEGMHEILRGLGWPGLFINLFLCMGNRSIG
jgi:hypothetical protein